MTLISEHTTVTRQWYEMALEVAFAKKTGDEFQDLFADLMSRRFREDFIRMRPWGNIGDRKNDGYLKSERRLFQVYAPQDMKAREAVRKINEDFAGCLPHWRDFFDTWVFVHNSRRGLSAPILDVLLKLRVPGDGVTIGHWGFEELLDVTLALSPADLAPILGVVPSQSQMMQVSAGQIAPLLQAIRTSRSNPSDAVRPPPPDKITINHLSEAVGGFLRLGMQKSDVVRHYLNRIADPTFGDDIAQAFSAKYKELRGSRLSPDQVFGALLEFSGGDLTDPESTHAALAVVAYLFERCDIFEAETGNTGATSDQASPS